MERYRFHADASIYFVTFTVVDTPDRRSPLAPQPTALYHPSLERYRFHADASIYFVTFTVVDWLPVFVSEPACRIVTNSLNFCHRTKGLRINAYVIMPTPRRNPRTTDPVRVQESSPGQPPWAIWSQSQKP